MAKIVIAGNTCIVKSRVSAEELAELKKYFPEMLQTLDEKKNVVFAIGTGKTASANASGVQFDGVSNDGFAICSLPIPAGVEDKEAWATDTLARVMPKLNVLEDSIATGAEAALASIASIKAGIETVI